MLKGVTNDHENVFLFKFLAGIRTQPDQENLFHN